MNIYKNKQQLHSPAYHNPRPVGAPSSSALCRKDSHVFADASFTGHWALYGCFHESQSNPVILESELQWWDGLRTKYVITRVPIYFSISFILPLTSIHLIDFMCSDFLVL